MADFTDDFNRANGALGANYTRGMGTADGLTIVSNAVLVADSGQNSRWIRSAETFGDDQIAGVDIVGGLGGGAGYAQIGARGSGQDATFQGYEVLTDGSSGEGHTEIVRINAGTSTLLKGVTTTFAAGNKIGIRVTGSNPVLIELLKDTGSGWTVVDSVNDSSASRIASGGKPFLSGWSNTAASQPVMDNFTAADIGDDLDTSVSPITGVLSMSGLAPLVNSFSSIVLRGTLVNEAGSPLANQTGIACLVWYGNTPSGAPDESLSSLTTNANGSYSFALALGGLAFNDPVYRVIYSGSPPDHNHCGRRIPSYE